SEFRGETDASAEAAALPDLKGFGTLPDLHVAMTLDPALAVAADPHAQSPLPASLIDVVTATLPNLNVVDLAAVRQAALPIFVAWAKAAPLSYAFGTGQAAALGAGHTDVPILVHTDATGATVVDDFATSVTDAQGNTYWTLASGNPVLDAQGNVIAQPTF